MTSPQEWVPKTREDWVGIFADGIAAERAAHEETVSKANAAKDAANAAKDGDKTGDNGAKPSFAERLLGIVH